MNLNKKELAFAAAPAPHTAAFRANWISSLIIDPHPPLGMKCVFDIPRARDYPKLNFFTPEPKIKEVIYAERKTSRLQLGSPGKLSKTSACIKERREYFNISRWGMGKVSGSIFTKMLLRFHAPFDSRSDQTFIHTSDFYPPRSFVRLQLSISLRAHICDWTSRNGRAR